LSNKENDPAYLYLKVDFGAHGFAVGDDDLTLILAFPVPAVQFDAATSGQKDLEKSIRNDILSKTLWKDGVFV
jgi:hypothetical protein